MFIPIPMFMFMFIPSPVFNPKLGGNWSEGKNPDGAVPLEEVDVAEVAEVDEEGDEEVGGASNP